MASLDLQCVSVMQLVTQCILRHEHWRAFGYRKRPKQGKLWDLLISSHERERQKVLGRELWAAAVGSVVFWALKNNQVDRHIYFVARVMSLCIDGLDGRPLWPALQFHTSDEALDFLQQACRDYGSSKVHSDLGAVFLQRCKASLSTKLPSDWLVGAAWLFNSCDSLFMGIIPALDGTAARNPDSDIDIDDTRYYEAAQQLFRQLERA